MRTKPKINVVIFGKFFGFGNWVDGIWLLHIAMHAGVSHVNHIMASSMLGYKPATLRNWHS